MGNPPFIGKGAIMRASLGDDYLKALKIAHSRIAGSADFVMYWWDRAAELLTRKKTPLRRFGLVTTNSITQSFNRRVIEKHLGGANPVSIIYAIPDHPWTKASRDAASVRISMTVAQAGSAPGRLLRVVAEGEIDTDSPKVELVATSGEINADLTVGVNATSVSALRANEGLSCNGVMLAGEGFVIPKALAELIKATDEPRGFGIVVFPHIGGSELTKYRRSDYVIDFFGLAESEARQRFPAAFQHVLEAVKPDRDGNSDRGFREKWWLFGRTRPEIRRANERLSRYIATTRTAKHRIFQFLEGNITANHEIVVISSADAFHLAVLSSRLHAVWALRAGGTLEDRPRYNKASTFDPFPFAAPDEAARARLRALGEELDTTRKAVQAEHPDLTLTGLYNVLEKVRAGAELSEAEAYVKARGRVLILKDLHDQIDRATADAYGWPHDLTDEQILERLVALNAERAKEEAAGHVRWLRPDHQIPRFAKGVAAPKSGELELGSVVVAIDKALPVFPKDKGEQVMAIRAVLQSAGRPMDAAAVSRAFKGGGRKIEQRVVQALSTLVRYAEITALPNGTFAARQVA